MDRKNKTVLLAAIVLAVFAAGILLGSKVADFDKRKKATRMYHPTWTTSMQTATSLF